MQFFSTESFEDDPSDDFSKPCSSCSSTHPVHPASLDSSANSSNTIVINANPINMIVVDGASVSTAVDQTGTHLFIYFCI